MNGIGMNAAAAIDSGSVDKLNARFYGKIKYPGPVHTLTQVSTRHLLVRNDLPGHRVLCSRHAPDPSEDLGRRLR